MPSIVSPSDIPSAIQQVSDPSFDSVKLFYSPPTWPVRSGSVQQPIHICVFDSSYNPPTRAHLAISLSSFPPVYPSAVLGEVRSDNNQEVQDSPYTARLLLLSARNVDKTLKEGDATLAQRIEMMKLQVGEMGRREGGVAVGNIAVAALNHPTFVGKSEILSRWLEERLPRGHPPVRFTFLIGTDTLTRIWIPKYYSPDAKLGKDMNEQLSHFFDHDQSRIVCAHRGKGEEDKKVEEEFINGSQECRYALRRGLIRFMREEELGEEEMGMSSTALRRAVGEVEGGDRAAMDRLCVREIGDYIAEQGLYRRR